MHPFRISVLAAALALPALAIAPAPSARAAPPPTTVASANTAAPAASTAAPSASGAPSIWILPNDVPLPDWAQSVEIEREGEPLAISPGGSRRGLIAEGVRLPLLGAVRGPGCIARWLLVGPLAYVCADKVKLSDRLAGVDEAIHPTPVDGLPFRYYFVGKEGADAFGKLTDIDDETPVEQLERGWAVATVGEVTYHGQVYVKTRRGRLIARAVIGPVAAFGFHGEELTAADGASPGVAWVNADKAIVYADAKSGAKAIGSRTRLQKLDVLETKAVGKETWLRIGEGASVGWVRGLDVRAPTQTTPPPEVSAMERWIDVDTATQTLVAYEGARPVFATLVSTGHVGTATPKGTFRIWVKLRTATMSNADEESDTTDEAAAYSIEDVPWVQYFSNGVALHGAFWHRRFGYVHSHGCVNMAPLDAMRLFDWTGPRLPRGWDASFPTTAEPATVVRVR